MRGHRGTGPRLTGPYARGRVVAGAAASHEIPLTLSAATPARR
jgi:hypothetical protein